MGKSNPLHTDFEEVFDNDLDAPVDPATAKRAQAIQDQIASLVNGLDAQPVGASASPPPVVPAPVQAPMVEVGPDVDLAAALYRNDGGDRPIPAISIHAFVNTPEAIRLVETVAADRRLARADIEIQPGGIPAAIMRYQGESTPNLLILETVGAAAELLAQIDELAGHCNPDIQVIVLGRANDIYLYRQLMLRGINEYLVPPVQPVQLIRAIGSLFADPEKPFVGKSVAVMGAKGGVGSSTLAHNLAWSLAEQCGVATTLVDLDLSFGTTALDFNQEAAQTVLDALAAPERADEAVLSRLIVKASEKLSLFVAPATVNTIHDLEPSAFDTVIEGVRRLTPFVVLDLPMQWNAWTRSTLVAADEVILVCAPDLASLRNGKNIADHLKSQRPNDAPPRLVLNMCGVPKRPEIPVKDFAQAIGIQPEIVLPFEPQLFGMATNNGQMIVDASREAKPSLAIRHLAGLLSGRMAAEPGKKSFLQKVLRK